MTFCPHYTHTPEFRKQLLSYTTLGLVLVQAIVAFLGIAIFLIVYWTYRPM